MKPEADTRFRRAWLAFGGIPGVVAVGSGFKRRGERTLAALALQIYVRRKRVLWSVPRAERIPPCFEGVLTDVVEIPINTPIADVALHGGAQVDSQQATVVGTLGCFAVKGPTGPGQIDVLLSAAHVLYDLPDMVAGISVGSPTLSCCWTSACGSVAETLDGVSNQMVDCGTARLNGKRSHVQILPGLGSTIVGGKPTGENTDSITDVAPLKNDPTLGIPTPLIAGDHVRKIGASTRLTGGTVLAVIPTVQPDGNLGSLVNQVLIRPIQAEGYLSKSTGKVDFCQFGDSGAIVMDDQNRAAGLLVRAADLKGQKNVPPWMGFGGIATDIHRVMQALGITIPPTPVATPTTKALGALLPGGAIFRPPKPTEEDRQRLATLALVREQLERFALGARLLAFIDRHHPEIWQLVNHDRRFKVVWHRVHGPKFVATLFRGIRGLDQPVPQQVDGAPIEEGLSTVYAALRVSGTPGLVQDMEPLWEPVRAAVRRGRTIRSAVDAFEDPSGQ